MKWNLECLTPSCPILKFLIQTKNSMCDGLSKLMQSSLSMWYCLFVEWIEIKTITTNSRKYWQSAKSKHYNIQKCNWYTINMVTQLPLNLRQVVIATTGAITVPNIGDGFYSGIKYWSWAQLNFWSGIYNQVELGSTYILYICTTGEPSFISRINGTEIQVVVCPIKLVT